MNDSRSRFLTQVAAPFGVGIAAALLHRWVVASGLSTNLAAGPALAMAFGAVCGLVLLVLRKKRAPRRHDSAGKARER